MMESFVPLAAALLPFILVGFFAQIIDGALGMAFVLTATSLFAVVKAWFI